MEARRLQGSDTFGQTVKPRGGKRQSRAYWLRVRAEERLVLLMEKGENGDHLSRPMPAVDWRDRKSLAEGRRFAKLSDKARLALLLGRRGKLAAELSKLAGHKAVMLAPTIKRQLAELDRDIEWLERELGC